MAKPSTVFVCSNCGNESSKWFGRCPACNEWNTCYEEKIPYKVINTNTWRRHCGVRGKTRVDKKRSMQLLAKNWYGLMPTEDEADALGIGKYCCDT